jgi:hypothetical protein
MPLYDMLMPIFFIRLSAYKVGIGDGLRQLAKQEKKDEQKKTVIRELSLLESAKKQEEEEDRRRLDRLEGPPLHNEDSKATVYVQQVKEEEEVVKVEFEDRHVKLEVLDELPATPQVVPPTPVPAYPSPAAWAGDAGWEDLGNDIGVADFNESDDESLDLDALEADLMAKPKAPSPAPAQPYAAQVAEEESLWDSVKQLVTFRETSVAIADEYLKKEGIKLRTGRRSTWELKDSDAQTNYRQGIKDAAKIDVRGRRLKGLED